MNIPSNWTFENSHIAANFDRHVREQLPWYELATGAVAHIARHYIPDGGLVYDIGASTGNIGKAISKTLEDRGALLISIDRSKSMAEHFVGPGKLVLGNAAVYEYQPFDFATLFLTLQFLTAQERGKLIRRLWEGLRPAGAMVVVDKIESGRGYTQTVLHRLTIAGKASTGTTAEQIVAKELSIAGVQRPLSRDFFIGTFDTAVEFFRFGEFVGYLIAKHE
jgi:tRNA (cmo5U34)-methyltransferase